MSTDVIVAGGGPVGLLTAALLDEAGVGVRVFEREAGPSEHPKAVAMHPRTLEVLTALETGGRRLSDLLVERGRPAPRAHFAALPEMLDYTGLETPYPFLLMVPQTRTERMLAGHLRERGVPVHYGHPVTGAEQDETAVRVRAGDGTYEARYLVGADGAHSVVRRLAGIGFPGTSPSLTGFVADVELDGPVDEPAHNWHRDTGSLSILPLPDGQHRLFGTLPPDTGLTPHQVQARREELGSLSVEGLRAMLRGIIGTDLGVRRTSWLSNATDSTRNAERYRAGRILIAGDAAHIHLPAGGQGLNVGLQDAANLAWKLAAEHQGWAPSWLVEGPYDYDSERRPVSARLTANTLAQGVLMHTFTPGGEALRGLFSDLIGRDGDTAQELKGWLSGLDLAYPAPDGAHPLTGTRAPDLVLTGAPSAGASVAGAPVSGPSGSSLMRALRQDAFVLADFTSEGRYAHLAGRRVGVRSAVRPGVGAWASPDAVLIRPDGYVAAAAEPSVAPDAFADEVAHWTTPTTVTPPTSPATQASPTSPEPVPEPERG
ncbi:FAD-dependent monooxygenase [Streptomyces sp. ODS28]|uniref:FAD-dependent monooxygenase n=1 Tax=Streptomyces sp. ODS28 TaxID=3136688 RepID=UPI0031E5CAF5